MRTLTGSKRVAGVIHATAVVDICNYSIDYEEMYVTIMAKTYASLATKTGGDLPVDNEIITAIDTDYTDIIDTSSSTIIDNIITFLTRSGGKYEGFLEV